LVVFKILITDIHFQMLTGSFLLHHFFFVHCAFLAAAVSTIINYRTLYLPAPVHP